MRPFAIRLVLLTATLLAPARPAESQEFRPDQSFSGYATGTALHADVLRVATGGPTLLDAEVAVSDASVDSDGLGEGLADETGRVIRPRSPAGKKSYGRGAAVEATLAGGSPLGTGLSLAGVASGAAPPSAPVRTQELGPIRLPPLVYAALVRGQAEPNWSDRTCVLGSPIASGLGSVADLQLLNLGGQSLPGGAFTRPLLAADAGSPVDRTVTQSRSFTYLSPNPDGTFALVSETRQTIAPVTLLRGSPNEITIEVLGEWVLRATATGKRGGASIEYGPAVNGGPATPVLRLIHAGQVIELTLQDLLGNPGLRLPLDPLVEIAVGEQPRPIASPGGAGDSGRPSLNSPEGTQAAAAVDVVRVNLLRPTPPGGPRVLQLRLGHMEARADVPAGGLACRIPVRKDGAPAFVNPGEGFTWTISIPSASDAFDGLRCDLVDLKAVDTARATPGVLFTILSASGGGVVSGTTVTWDDLGRYRPGKRPIVLTVTGRVEPGSARGVLSDTVDVSASIDNCTGGLPVPPLTGQSPTALLQGTFTLIGPIALPGAAMHPSLPSGTTPPARSGAKGGPMTPGPPSREVAQRSAASPAAAPLAVAMESKSVRLASETGAHHRPGPRSSAWPALMLLTAGVLVLRARARLRRVR